jgi:hypothetical protein
MKKPLIVHLSDIESLLTSVLLDEIDKSKSENPDLPEPDFEDFPELDNARGMVQELISELPDSVLATQVEID